MSIVKSFSFPEGDIRGDMFYIKHDSINFTVIDCFLKDGEGKNARKAEILKEINTESRGKVHNFISTHPDNDHIAGIKDLDVNWNIENFYAVCNDRPQDKNDADLSYYQKLLRRRDSNYIERNFNHDSYYYPYVYDMDNCISSISNSFNSSGIYFHWPYVANDKFQRARQLVSQGRQINNICPIFTYRVKDGATYMWMGDLETDMQQAYYDACKKQIPKIDILFQPHHGRNSGRVPPDLCEALKPKLIVIGNAPSEHIDYGDPDKTITQNTAGDIWFENDGKEVRIYTKNEINNPPSCLKQDGEEPSMILLNMVPSRINWHYIGSLTV